MALSKDLIYQLVKASSGTSKPTKSESIVYGQIVESDGVKKVRLDGSNIETPISATADTIVGERVTVMIKNHTAIVTGNITSPAARTADVQELSEGVSEIDGKTTEAVTGLENKVDKTAFDEQVLRIDELVTYDTELKEKLPQYEEEHKTTKEQLVALTAETGTSGIWSYKKWASNDVELWGALEVSELECATEFDGWYRTNVISPEAFPFELYGAIVMANYESSSHGAILWATTSTTVTNTPNYYLIRPTSSTITSGKINFHVVGKLIV